jgi:hypothetical protein
VNIGIVPFPFPGTVAAVAEIATKPKAATKTVRVIFILFFLNKSC